MKTLSRFLSSPSLIILFFLPLLVSAQPDTTDAPLDLGDTVAVAVDNVGVTRFAFEADEGQTVTLRWEAAVAADHVLKVRAEVTDANGQVIPSTHLLDTTTTSTQVFALTGPGPYNISAHLDDGGNATLSLLEDDPITVVEQAPVELGETATGVIPAADELIVYPINVQPGEVFTVHVSGVDPENRRSSELTYPLAFLTVLRDANGRIVEPDARTNGRVYTAPDAVPLRLEMARYLQRVETMGVDDAAYTIRLDPGNTIAVFGEVAGQGGLLALGQRIEEDATGIAGDRLFTLDAEEGQTVTLRLDADTNYLWDVARMLEFEPNEGIYTATVQLVRSTWALMPDSSNPRLGCACVYAFEGDGPPPYVLSLIQQINDPHVTSAYSVQLDREDTLPRNILGTLVPGGMVQGTIPAWDGTASIYALDVDPESTITINWGNPEVQFFITEVDGEVVLPLNNPWDDGYSILDLSEATAPFFVSVNVPEWSGAPYTLTLAEGETPLAPTEATPIPNTPVLVQPVLAGATGTETDVGATSSSNTTASTATTCTVTAGGANQRSGPGTTFAVSGTLNGSASADGQAIGADGMIWYRLSTGVWVRSDVVSADAGCSALPTVS